MPIVTHTFTGNTQADGRISYVLRLYDQDGTEYTQVGLLPANFDTTAFVTMRKVEMDEQLAAMEFQTLLGI